VLPPQEQDDGDEEEKEGVLHEETFHRNPSMKVGHHERSRLQLAEETAVHIWHRLPLLQVLLTLEKVQSRVSSVRTGTTSIAASGQVTAKATGCRGQSTLLFLSGTASGSYRYSPLLTLPQCFYHGMMCMLRDGGTVQDV